jgi:HAD superfamily hydrolase (TIGR01549 family)
VRFCQSFPVTILFRIERKRRLIRSEFDPNDVELCLKMTQKQPNFALKTSAKRRFSVVIFDMDGTLTEELLDFAKIREEIGAPEKSPILEFINGLQATEQARAHAILHRHEMAAAEVCQVRDGAVETLAALQVAGIRTALLTRNSAACARSVLGRHGLKLEVVATREDLPHKPHRDAIWNILRQFAGGNGEAEKLGEQTLMVGDYLYDVQTAANAGVASALLCARAELPAFAGQATYVVRHLSEVVEIAVGGENGHG